MSEHFKKTNLILICIQESIFNLKADISGRCVFFGYQNCRLYRAPHLKSQYYKCNTTYLPISFLHSRDSFFLCVQRISGLEHTQRMPHHEKQFVCIGSLESQEEIVDQAHQWDFARRVFVCVIIAFAFPSFPCIVSQVCSLSVCCLGSS